ncbi:MAG: hypothetical protein JO321_09650 [Solirubrobacterales bacterium]|nr:hypothetical protein [Solirubrobacterales bacterium]MBV9166191.1 hypothetical protein [Solirubrobacterales bacterium]MBV9535663.1 hypothetical protein [Solirubrobacterales bacterium]
MAERGELVLVGDQLEDHLRLERAHDHLHEQYGRSSSVGPGPDAGALAMNAPTFRTCKDSLGGTDMVTTASGWKVNFVSDTGNGACPAGTGKDETSGSDCVVLTRPPERRDHRRR